MAARPRAFTMANSVLREQVCEVLRDRIIQGQIPPGTSLGEERLAAELNVSRTPFREAIRQLAEEGFVVHEPHKGARVAELTPEMVREIYQVREALEGMAAREAAKRMDPSRITWLRNRLEELRPRIEQGNLRNTGDEIHEELFAACGNKRLQRLMWIYRGKVNWIQQTSFRISGRLVSAFREHESIVSALESRSPDWAEAAARAHIRNTLAELLELLEPPTRKHVPAKVRTNGRPAPAHE